MESVNKTSFALNNYIYLILFTVVVLHYMLLAIFFYVVLLNLVNAAVNNEIGINIINGTEVPYTDKSFSFIASLQNKMKQHFCGGSLIHPEWIITAAHCVARGAPYYIQIGDYDLSKKTSKNFILIGMNMNLVKIHPYYISPTLGNDIALIHLPRSVNTIRPINISTGPFSIPMEEVNQKLTVAGWGITNRSQYTTTTRLHKVVVPQISNCECKLSYGMINDNQICAGFVDGGYDACQGDSGGPLFYTGLDGSKTIVGIVSWGKGCAEPKNFGVYTRVSQYVQFIKTHIKNVFTPEQLILEGGQQQNCTRTQNPTQKPTKMPSTRTQNPTQKPTKMPSTLVTKLINN